jgi:lysophospholipase
MHNPLTNRNYQKVTMTSKIPAIDRRTIPDSASESFWIAADGWKIRRIDWKGTGQRGAILFLPGRGDIYEKYLETLSYYALAGWSVTAIDWRGQGGSGRLLPDPYVGHIDDFATWIADLKAFYAVWKAEHAGPHVVIAHSMGGHLTMRALVEKAVNPDAVILSAPMLGIQTGGLPLAFNHAFARLMCRIGRSEQAAWKVSEKPLSPASLRSKILTHDVDRYNDELAWWDLRPGIKLGPPSWQWVERAMASIRYLDQPGQIESVQTPILLLAAVADQLVSTKRIIKDNERLPHSEIMVFGREAAHELLREADGVRDQCLSLMDSFLDTHAPRS